jgi:2-polyprenyl-3-methyl-5-hydroxy-6-metoxy-1,4-benzoquinol methylase
MKNTIELKIENNASWYKKWFDSIFYHQLYSNRSEKEATDFIDTLMDELKPPPGSTMLDLGCGAGRHAKWLSVKGYDVTGLDLAASSIQSAKKYEKTNLRFENMICVIHLKKTVLIMCLISLPVLVILKMMMRTTK